MAASAPWGNEFTLKERKHYGGAQPNSLTPGLVPADDRVDIITGHHLSRSRHCHDDNASMARNEATPSRQAQDSLEQWQSSYQAQTSGQSGQQQRRSGKKCFNTNQGNATSQAASHFGGTGTFFTGGPTIAPRLDIVGVPQDFAFGTTKATDGQVIPGYTGHIPKASGQGGFVPSERNNDKSLILDNYKPYGPSYSGRLGR